MNQFTKVRVENRQGICEDFKTIQREMDAEAAEKELETFFYKWEGLHKKVMQSFPENPFPTNQNYPSERGRKVIYTRILTLPPILKRSIEYAN